MDGEKVVYWDAVQIGVARLESADWRGAIEALRQVAEVQPNNEYAFYFMGCAHLERHELGAAMSAFGRALELAPAYVGAMVHLGETLRLLGRDREAARLAQRVLSQHRDDPDALYLLGLIHYGRAEREQATRCLRRFLQAHPDADAACEAESMLQMLEDDIYPLPQLEGVKN